MPYIQNFLISEHSFTNPNTSIVQDKNGNLYFGSINGLVKYDGINYDLIRISGKTKFTIDTSNTIYVGGYNLFGYLEYNSKNELVFHSVLEDIEELKSFGQIKEIIAINDKIFFSTKNKLYSYSNNVLKMVDKDPVYIRPFNVNGKLYVYKHKTGIVDLEEGVPWIFPRGEFFKGRMVNDILPYSDYEILIKCDDSKSFYKYSFDTIIQFATEADRIISNNGYRNACLLSNNHYSIATESGGLVLINKEGKVLSILGKQEGLFDYFVLNSYADKTDNIWALHNNGLSRIEYPGSVTYFRESNGLRGNVNEMIRHNGILYIATTQGVFFYHNSHVRRFSNRRFYKINDLTQDCKSFFIYNNNLFVVTSKGIYMVIDNYTVPVYYGSINTSMQSKYDSSLVFVGNDNGIVGLRNRLDVIQTIGSISVVNQAVNMISEGDTNIIWMDAEYSSLMRIDLKARKNNYKIFGKNQGLPDNYEWMNICNSADGLIFSSSKGIYRYNNDSSYFYPDTLLGINSSNNQWASPIVPYNNKDLILITGSSNKLSKKVYISEKDTKTGKYSLKYLPIHNLEDYIINTIYPDKNKVIWIAGLGGLVRYDANYNEENRAKFSVQITKVVFDNDTLMELHNNYSEEDRFPQLKFEKNNVRFNFSATSFSSQDKTTYQYSLRGFENNFSDWSPINFKEYTNLRSGIYVFVLRAKNINGDISEIQKYAFEILPPIYRTWWAYLIYAVVIISLFIAIRKLWIFQDAREKRKLEKIILERTKDLEIEKQKTENLLTNVLPKSIAEELKSEGKAKTRKYNLVSVLFADIQGFTRISEQINPDDLVSKLDGIFYRFDSYVEKYNIEKIKTIGDAYMCAGGLPIKNSTNPVEVVLAALEMQQFMKNLQKKGAKIWDLRIGIHTGPVIAGVVGSKKLSYDIWGDTVNTASRMESSGEPGKVNISGTTYEVVKDFFICEYRGKMPVKFKGEIDMYFVKGIRPELSVNLKGVPNKRFNIQLQHLRLLDLEEYITTQYKAIAPERFLFHNLKHMLDVYVQVELLGRAEGVSQEELLLLRTAALLHDYGYFTNYNKHEEEGARIAETLLPEYNYTIRQIKTIKELILVTRIPQKPKTLLQEIICDADLNYLGRADFMDISDTLFYELQRFNKVKDKKEWDERQIEFLSKHKFYTKTAKMLKEVKIDTQIEKIKK